ncbi:alpha/beta hydrolase fold domain-containing protein [bacterium]|nr:alpha/beta hydrolase fold domain-containing protein [bacterium]
MKKQSHDFLILLIFFCFFVVPFSFAQNAKKTNPTHADFAYGWHPQQVFDIWVADADTPTPLVIYIHGGGFRGGSKDGISAKVLRQYLDAGISVASVEYRFVQHAKLPAAHEDCRRAIQTLRAHAKKWNLDSCRFGAFGGSAGAQLCMWLGFHDDMADPASDDPIARQSTRLCCLATRGGQATMDLEWWKQWIPGYDQPHRQVTDSFGEVTGERLAGIVADISALHLISPDDPPIFMHYNMKPDAPIPTDERKARGWKVHHVMFGIQLKRELDKAGVEAVLHYPGMDIPYKSQEDFLLKKLLKE